MNNKLGLTEYSLRVIEKEIVKLKMKLLNESFSFNKSLFDLEYLKELHNFLFSDIYFEDQTKTRKLSKIELHYINNLLEQIKIICITNSFDIEKILEILCELWYFQPFYNGNTRTLIAYLKVLNDSFLLELNIDLDKEIKSAPSIFKKENFVNQKRLTKK